LAHADGPDLPARTIKKFGIAVGDVSYTCRQGDAGLPALQTGYTATLYGDGKVPEGSAKQFVEDAFAGRLPAGVVGQVTNTSPFVATERRLSPETALFGTTTFTLTDVSLTGTEKIGADGAFPEDTRIDLPNGREKGYFAVDRAFTKGGRRGALCTGSQQEYKVKFAGAYYFFASRFQQGSQG
jgi:hypothetical protein